MMSKKRLSFFSVVVLGIVFVGVILSGLTANTATGENSATATPENQPDADGLYFDGDQAFEHVSAQVDFGFRPTGSEAWQLTGDYIIEQLEAYGWEAEEQPFDVNPGGETIEARNIIGKLGVGEGPVIILSTHYDTRLLADHDPDPTLRTEPVMGANDAASGVGVLLELARVLGENYELHNEIWLVFFDAEDNGRIDGWDWILGSTYMAQNLEIEPEYLILLDMIGEINQDLYYEGNSLQAAPELTEGLWATAAELGYEEYFIPTVRHTMIDDHKPFIEQGIPAVDIIDFDYTYWHTTGDTLDKISVDSLTRVGRVLEAYLKQDGAIE
jgi:Zn-dependent M28 family amino/carboxypeptidase